MFLDYWWLFEISYNTPRPDRISPGRTCCSFGGSLTEVKLYSELPTGTTYCVHQNQHYGNNAFPEMQVSGGAVEPMSRGAFE